MEKKEYIYRRTKKKLKGGYDKYNSPSENIPLDGNLQFVKDQTIEICLEAVHQDDINVF